MQKLPQHLQALVELLLAAGIYPPEQAPQHVLINSYDKGAGIPPHMDGPLYSPRVATITLGGPAVMAFHKALPDGSPGELASEVCAMCLCGSFWYWPTCVQLSACLSLDRLSKHKLLRLNAPVLLLVSPFLA